MLWPCLQMHDIVVFYYAEVKKSPEHRRWREQLQRGGAKGEALLTGSRQAKLLAELGEF